MANNLSEIIAEFPKCPICQSEDVVSTIAVAELKLSGKIPIEARSRLKTEVTPLETPTMIGVMAKTIATHYDVCAKCGTPRCTYVEKLMVPVMPQQLPGQPPQRM